MLFPSILVLCDLPIPMFSRLGIVEYQQIISENNAHKQNDCVFYFANFLSLFPDVILMLVVLITEDTKVMSSCHLYNL